MGAGARGFEILNNRGLCSCPRTADLKINGFLLFFRFGLRLHNRLEALVSEWGAPARTLTRLWIYLSVGWSGFAGGTVRGGLAGFLAPTSFRKGVCRRPDQGLL